MGPELTRIGNKAKPEWLAAWLANPRIYDATTPMPHYRFTPQQIATLTTYLQTKTDSDYGVRCSSRCSEREADCSRKKTHRRTGMRCLP